MASEVLTFTGVNKVRAMRGHNTLGTSPDTFSLEIVPQASGSVPSLGTLVWGNEGLTITLTNCRIDRQRTVVNMRGFVARLFIWDRRWAWRNRLVTGRYNVRRPDGTVDPATEKTPRELATILLTAMGEAATVVTMIPNSDRPEVDWQNAQACDELEDLLLPRGCNIGIPDNVTTIYLIGTGSGAPNNDNVVSVQQDLDPPELPQYIRACLGPTVVQSKLLLTAVGLDNDGEWKQIDDLSYKPAGGWGVVSDFDYPEITDEIDRMLAKQTVFKVYQATSQADGSQYIEGIGQDLDDLSAIWPLSRSLLDTYTDLDGQQRAGEAYIEGLYWRFASPDYEEGNTDPFTRLERPFRLVGEVGRVEFTEPVLKLDTDTNQWAPADLYLTCTYSVLDSATHQYEAVEVDRSLGGLVGIAPVHVEEQLYRTVRHIYQAAPDGDLVDSVVDNYSTVLASANTILDYVEAGYSTQTAYVVFYRHIGSIWANGVIFQVGWTAGMIGFTTQAGVATESVPHARRQLDKQRQRIARQISNYQNLRLRRRRRMQRRHWR